MCTEVSKLFSSHDNAQRKATATGHRISRTESNINRLVRPSQVSNDRVQLTICAMIGNRDSTTPGGSNWS